LWRQLPLVEPEALPGAAGGFQHRTRRIYGEVIRASGTVASKGVDLTALEKLVLTAVAYFQPVTRAGVADILCRAISRDVIAALRGADLIATGPRSPQPGAPHTYVTTPAFPTLWGLASLGDLPDLDRLEEAGLLGKAALPEELRGALGITGNDEDEDRAASAADDDGEADEDYAGLRWARQISSLQLRRAGRLGLNYLPARDLSLQGFSFGWRATWTLRRVRPNVAIGSARFQRRP
jgi:chromosome segregation and condensation protein ScpB